LEQTFSSGLFVGLDRIADSNAIAAIDDGAAGTTSSWTVRPVHLFDLLWCKTAFFVDGFGSFPFIVSSWVAIMINLVSLRIQVAFLQVVGVFFGSVILYDVATGVLSVFFVGWGEGSVFSFGGGRSPGRCFCCHGSCWWEDSSEKCCLGRESCVSVAFCCAGMVGMKCTEAHALSCRNTGQGGVGGLGGGAGMNMDMLLNMFGGLGGTAPSNPDGTWV